MRERERERETRTERGRETRRHREKGKGREMKGVRGGREGRGKRKLSHNHTGHPHYKLTFTAGLSALPALFPESLW